MSDSLFRVSLKAIIFNERSEVLVVKESGRTTWSLPGGGIEYGESMEHALARELREEVGLGGEFTYTLVSAADPKLLVTRPVHQINLIFHVEPKNLPHQRGTDADAMEYVNPAWLENSEHKNERAVAVIVRAFQK